MNGNDLQCLAQCSASVLWRQRVGGRGSRQHRAQLHGQSLEDHAPLSDLGARKNDRLSGPVLEADQIPKP